jgi:hypothetical protein
MKTAWQIHLEKTRAECKGKVPPQEVMKIAAKTYKSKTDPSKNKASCVVRKHTRKSRGGKKRVKKGHKGAPSITRPGHLDFRTHKGDKYYNRQGHRQRFNIEGVYGRPYQGTRKHKKGQKKRSRKAVRRELGRGAASDACTARLAEVMTALGAAKAQLAQAQSENRRLTAANVQSMNLQGEIQSCRNQVASLERQVSDLQAQAAAAPVIDVEAEPAALSKLPIVAQDKAAALDAIDKVASDADETKGAIEKATDAMNDAMKNVASQITDAITGATETAEADAAAAKDEVEAKIETAGGKRSRRRRRKGRATRR